MSTTHNTTAEKTGGHALCMLRGKLFIELRTTVPAVDTYSTAVLMYGEDSSHNYTLRTELQPTLRYRVLLTINSALQNSAMPPPFPLPSILRDIRGRQGARGCGLESNTARLPHRASCLSPLLVVCY